MTLRIGAAVLALATAACGGGEVLVGAEEAGSTVTLAEGERLVVQLASNITTGYHWEMDEEPDAAVLSFTGSDYENTSPEDVAGGGGVERWTFEAAGEGGTSVTLGYHPPSQGEPAVETYSIAVEVTAER